MNNAILVSVVMITYNHEKYIRQALDGIMMQRGGFEMEVIVANDHSTDNTSRVIQQYIQENDHAGIIKYVDHNTNIGMMKNFTSALCMSKGKYIAVCEGDDYWTDENKLQEQLSFLESNKEVNLCSHFIREFHEYDNSYHDFTDDGMIKRTFAEFAENGCYGVYTCGIMYRNVDFFRSYLTKDWVLKLDGGDHLLLLLASINDHPVYILPKIMGVYRKHSGGIWTGSSVQKRAMGGFLNTYLYKKNLPVPKEQLMHFDWNDSKHFIQLIYSKKRPLPAFANKILNKSLAYFPRLFGRKLYSTLFHKLYMKMYGISFKTGV
jgi:glycosyltransferase involved in cell wall biosynthesis